VDFVCSAVVTAVTNMLKMIPGTDQKLLTFVTYNVCLNFSFARNTNITSAMKIRASWQKWLCCVLWGL